MNRRSFLLGILAASSGLAGALLIGDASAAPAVCAAASPPCPDDIVAALPDGTQADWSQAHRGRHRHGPPHHHRRHARRQVRVCRTFRDRFGRRVRRCHWAWV